MKFRTFVRGLNETVKEVTLNRILDKLSRKKSISDGEKTFLDNYDEHEGRDWKMISKEELVKTIQNLISKGKRVICNLHDRDGKIGLQVVDVKNNFQDEEFTLLLKGDEKIKLSDRFLYNVVWEVEGNFYSIEEDSEYFEKIPIKND
jgi:hypothetical protein